MPWIEILTLLATFVRECLSNNRSEADIKAEIRSPGPLAQLKLETAIRKKKGLNLREWVSQREAIMEPIYTSIRTAPDADIDLVLETAKEIDWTA